MEKSFYTLLAAVMLFVSLGARYAWCADSQPVKATLKITVRNTSRCAGGNCQVKTFSYPIQLQPAAPCKNGKCNLQRK